MAVVVVVVHLVRLGCRGSGHSGKEKDGGGAEVHC